MNDVERDYLQEARQILEGKSLYLPEREHMQALDRYYKQLLRVAISVAEIKILKGEELWPLQQ